MFQIHLWVPCFVYLLANVNPSLLTFEVIIYNFSYQSGPSTIFLNPFMPYAPLSISENSESRKINKFLSVIRCLNGDWTHFKRASWNQSWHMGSDMRDRPYQQVILILYWCSKSRAYRKEIVLWYYWLIDYQQWLCSSTESFKLRQMRDTNIIEDNAFL